MALILLWYILEYMGIMRDFLFMMNLRRTHVMILPDTSKDRLRETVD